MVIKIIKLQKINSIRMITDLDWIKQQMLFLIGYDISDKCFKDEMTRKLIIQPMKDNYNEIGSIMFSLNGSPPRCYAIFSHANLSTPNMIFIDTTLKKTKLVKTVDFDFGLISKELKLAKLNRINSI